jgi:hypothetical protein
LCPQEGSSRNQASPPQAPNNNAETQQVARSQAIVPLESAIFYNERRHVGLQGESVTYRMLKNILGEKFQQENWTSKVRQYAGPFSAWQAPPGDEEDSSDDLTYFDEDQTSLKWLVSNGRRPGKRSC